MEIRMTAIIIGTVVAVFGVFYERYADKGDGRWGLNWFGWFLVIIIVAAGGWGIWEFSDERIEARRREEEARRDAEENRQTINRLESKVDRQYLLIERLSEELKKSSAASQPAVQELLGQLPDLSWDGGSIAIPISDASGTRLSENFTGPPGSGQRSVRIEILNVPPEQGRLVRMQLKLDRSFAEDPDRSPVVTGGDVITLDAGQRGYYFAGRDNAEAVLRQHPKALLRLSLQ